MTKTLRFVLYKGNQKVTSFFKIIFNHPLHQQPCAIKCENAGTIKINCFLFRLFRNVILNIIHIFKYFAILWRLEQNGNPKAQYLASIVVQAISPSPIN